MISVVIDGWIPQAALPRLLSTSLSFGFLVPTAPGNDAVASLGVLRFAMSPRDGFAAFGLSLIVRNLRPVCHPLRESPFLGPAPLLVDQKQESFARAPNHFS
jgi:hypothetical protein